jgi:deoxyhypusine synthase
MKRYSPLDLKNIKTYPIGRRKNKVGISDFARVCRKEDGFGQFLDSLPNILAAREFREIVDAVVHAHTMDRPVVMAMGGHVIKCGLSPVVIDLIEQGVITAVAMNGAGSIHDYEVALIGSSSEDVAEELGTGKFGMARETGAGIHSALARGGPHGWGYGESLGQYILTESCPHRDQSILAAAVRKRIPATVHVSIGADIIHMHPDMDAKVTGEATFHDFRTVCSVVADLGHGGVWMNVGSAVLMPEVFLKAVSVARNMGHDCFDFVTVNLDMLQHYRPRENVVKRPTQRSGRGYSITGHHEIMIPLLARAILEKLDTKDKNQT